MTKRPIHLRAKSGKPNGLGKLRRVLESACDEYGFNLEDLTVLSVQVDPYRLDTPASHRLGQWAATQLAQAYGAGKQAHLRGLHYAMVVKQKGVKKTFKKPDGKIYRNTHADWKWLSEYAVKAARWLGYIPFDRFKDQRNPDAIIHRRPRPPSEAWVAAELSNIDLDDIDLKPSTDAFVPRHTFQSVIFGEKSSLEEVLLPLAKKRESDLYLATGEISDTLIYRIAKDAANDGRPLVVFTVTDCDPAGWQMSISITRKLQAFRDLRFPGLRFAVVPAALTVEQVKDLDLPSTPLKESESRAAKWMDAFGVEQTEVDALLTPEELEKNTLRDLVDDVMADYHDDTLAGRVSEAATEWTDAAQDAIDQHVDAKRLAKIRRDAEAVSDDIDSINERLRNLVDDVALPPVDVPQAEDPDPDPRHYLGQPRPRLGQRNAGADRTQGVRGARVMTARERLPNRRHCESFGFELNGLRFTATVGRFSDGRPGELFLNNHKHGNQSDTNARDAAILLSFALQHGADINVIRKSLCRDSAGRPLGPVAAALDLIVERDREG